MTLAEAVPLLQEILWFLAQCGDGANRHSAKATCLHGNLSELLSRVGEAAPPEPPPYSLLADLRVKLSAVDDADVERVARVLEPDVFAESQDGPLAELDRDMAKERVRKVLLAASRSAAPPGAREALEDEEQAIGCSLAVLRLANQGPDRFAAGYADDPDSLHYCASEAIAYLERKQSGIKAALSRSLAGGER